MQIGLVSLSLWKNFLCHSCSSSEHCFIRINGIILSLVVIFQLGFGERTCNLELKSLSLFEKCFVTVVTLRKVVVFALVKLFSHFFHSGCRFMRKRKLNHVYIGLYYAFVCDLVSPYEFCIPLV